MAELELTEAERAEYRRKYEWFLEREGHPLRARDRADEHIQVLRERLPTRAPDPESIVKAMAAACFDAGQGIETGEDGGGVEDPLHEAAHVRDSVIRLYEWVAEIYGDSVEHMGGAYGDAFDVIGAALNDLGQLHTLLGAAEHDDGIEGVIEDLRERISQSPSDTSFEIVDACADMAANADEIAASMGEDSLAKVVDHETIDGLWGEAESERERSDARGRQLLDFFRIVEAATGLDFDGVCRRLSHAERCQALSGAVLERAQLESDHEQIARVLADAIGEGASPSDCPSALGWATLAAGRIKDVEREAEITEQRLIADANKMWAKLDELRTAVERAIRIAGGAPRLASRRQPQRSAGEVPMTYANAAKMPRDARTCLDYARLTWAGLGAAEQRALVAAGLPDQRPLRAASLGDARRVVLDRLESKGLLVLHSRAESLWYLTPLGFIVRQAGTRTDDLREFGNETAARK